MLKPEIPLHSELSSILLGGPERAQQRLMKEMKSLTMTEHYNAGHNNRWCCGGGGGDELLPSSSVESFVPNVRLPAAVKQNQLRSKRNPLTSTSNLSHENRAAFYSKYVE